jgi:hypothetical protein
MTELQSKKLIVLKGILFMVITLTCSGLIYFYCPKLIVAVLLLILIWASARAYYFLFYVLEKYVDPAFKYSGLLDLLKAIRAHDREGVKTEPSADDESS